MTSVATISATPRTTDSRTAVLGAVSGLVAAGLTTAFAHNWTEVVVSVAVIAVVTAVIFGVVVPRAVRKESAGGTALALAVPAALLVLPAFWSGIPLVLGVAGLVVGNAGRTASSGAGKCIAAVVLGALAVLAYISIYVASGIAGETGFLFD